MTTHANRLIVTGGRVGLRDKAESDAWNDFLWRSDDELAELDATYPLKMSYEQFVPIHQDDLNYISSRSHRFAIIELSEGKHIGNCMYYDLDRKAREAELGIMIGDRGYWNGGYGTEAVTLLTRWMFNELELNRVYLKTLDWNVRAQRAFAKAGFTQKGFNERGRYRFMLMDIKREAWEQMQADRPES